MSETLRVGVAVDDLCRACKMVRKHTVIVAGGPVTRVICDYCGSQHNYRGGERAVRRSSASTPRPAPGRSETFTSDEPFPLVSDRERSSKTMEHESTQSAPDLELMLRRVIREETGLTPVVPAAKWRGGELILKPGRDNVQDKSWPIETFFHKIVMLRNRLRTLEQQVNAADLPDDLKIKLQGYITACYGSLTSFNVLFAEDDDKFRGSSG